MLSWFTLLSTWFALWLPFFRTTPIEGGRKEQKRMKPNRKALRELSCIALHDEKKAEYTVHSGFTVPLRYAEQNLTREVKEARRNVSMHDASYKRQFFLYGKDSSKFLHALVASDIKGLKEGNSRKVLMTNYDGGIIDILRVSKLKDGYLHVVANSSKVMAEIQIHLKSFGGDAAFLVSFRNDFFTFHGPNSAAFLKTFFDKVDHLHPMNCKEYDGENWIQNHDALVSRNDDTEEDGFSVSFHDAYTFLCSYHYTVEEICLMGLEGSECLRIEAGECLIGKELDEDTSPVEACLTHLISEEKRQFGGFPGANRVLRDIRDGPKKILKGFISYEENLLEGYAVSTEDGTTIGYITSGTYSPTLTAHIAMGYLYGSYKESNNLLFNGNIKGRVHQLPFVAKEQAGLNGALKKLN